jgi:hypothetical protein
MLVSKLNIPLSALLGSSDFSVSFLSWDYSFPRGEMNPPSPQPVFVTEKNREK